MSKLLNGHPWTPACATNIRETFKRVEVDADMKSRIEGAKQVMKTLAANVRPLRREKGK